MQSQSRNPYPETPRVMAISVARKAPANGLIWSVSLATVAYAWLSLLLR
jgi:hypothetical protein